jgi:hypothetical protein
MVETPAVETPAWRYNAGFASGKNFKELSLFKVLTPASG